MPILFLTLMGRRGGPALCGGEVDKHKRQDYRPAIDWLAFFVRSLHTPKSLRPEQDRALAALTSVAGRSHCRTATGTPEPWQQRPDTGVVVPDRSCVSRPLNLSPLSCVHRCGVVILPFIRRYCGCNRYQLPGASLAAT